MNINESTQVCISIAKKPGSFGIRFHNFLYHRLNLNFLYKSFAVESAQDAIQAVRALGLRGCSVTMPFKMEVLPCVDRVDPIAEKLGAANTIVNEAGILTAFNTDYLAFCGQLGSMKLNSFDQIILFGNGGVARAAAQALIDTEPHSKEKILVTGRSALNLSHFAEKFGISWSKSDDLKVEKNHLFIQATPMTELSLFDRILPHTKAVVDVVVSMKGSTPLISWANKNGIHLFLDCNSQLPKQYTNLNFILV